MARVEVVADQLRAYWSGRPAIILVNRYDGATRALIEELVGCGAVVSAVVAGDRLAPEVLDRLGIGGTTRVWQQADHGGPVRRKEFDAWLRTPPADLADWLDEVDPQRRCVVLGTSYTDIARFCDRPVHGWWRPEWQVYEDKTQVDHLWEAVGMPAPPYVVLAPDDPALDSWWSRLDRGRGVVIAVDNTDGIMGSAKGLRWVRDRAELARARTAFAAARRVRLAAYLPGAPCSVLGMVLPDGVAVFEPFEIVTLRRLDPAELAYGGTSTHWRAAPGTRARIRQHVRAVGERLAEVAGYRGMFSVDGVTDQSGFAATELNPRHVSGLTLWSGLPGFPARLFHRAVAHGEPTFAGVGWRDVEEAFCAAIRSSPASMVKVPVPGLDGVGQVRTGTVELTVLAADGPRVQTVGYRYEPAGHGRGGWVRPLFVEPPLPDGSVAPAAAALAELFGAPGLVPFQYDSAKG